MPGFVKKLSRPTDWRGGRTDGKWEASAGTEASSCHLVQVPTAYQAPGGQCLGKGKGLFKAGCEGDTEASASDLCPPLAQSMRASIAGSREIQGASLLSPGKEALDLGRCCRFLSKAALVRVLPSCRRHNLSVHPSGLRSRAGGQGLSSQHGDVGEEIRAKRKTPHFSRSFLPQTREFLGTNREICPIACMAR